MLINGSKPLGGWFRIGSSDPQQGSVLDIAFQVVLILAALIVLLRRRFDWSGAMGKNGWLIALVLIMLFSAIWSDLPVLTLKRTIKEFLAVLMAFVLLSEPSPRHAIELLLRRTTYIFMPLSPILIKFFPAYGRLYTRWEGAEMWTGVTMHKNSLARLCIIAAFYLIWSLIRRWQGKNPARWKYQTYAELFLLAISFWLLGGPGGRIFYSATSVYALTAGLLTYAGLSLAHKRGWPLTAGVLKTAVLFIMLFGTVSVFRGGSGLGGFASATGRDATLTGRTQVWEALVPVVMTEPIVGRGFAVFWTPERRELFQISGAHNGYLDILLELGFAGLVLVIGFYLSSSGKAYRELDRDFDWSCLWYCFIIMLAVHNMGESSIGSLTSFLTAIILFMTVGSAGKTSLGEPAD
jgi:O-antigen ligase